jgi:8-oxo-dGTP pyrophosphatase MutT (NUDIX family)
MLGEAPRPAAVLVPFLQAPVTPNGAPEWQLLYTRRTDTLAEHKGQVAFPGGRADAQDGSAEATALRETYEEIGLAPDEVRILGRLENMLTITNYCITPVVGIIPWPYSFHLASNEVSRVFTIPLAWLADPRHHETRPRALPPPYGSIPVVYFERYDGELLWGISASITLALLSALAKPQQ